MTMAGAPHNSTTQLEHLQTGFGVNGRDLVKYFVGKTPFSGCYEDRLMEMISLYQYFCNMCDVTPAQKIKAMYIILKEPADANFSKHVRDAKTYEEADYRLQK